MEFPSEWRKKVPLGKANRGRFCKIRMAAGAVIGRWRMVTGQGVISGRGLLAAAGRKYQNPFENVNYFLIV